MGFTIMDGSSLPNLSIWIHGWGSWIIISLTINVWNFGIITSITCWGWCWSTINHEKSWGIWESCVSNIFLLSTISLEVVGIFLVLFLTMGLTIMDGSSLPNWSIWVHLWSTWIVVSLTINVWNFGIITSITCWGWCWSTINHEKSWGIWESCVSNIFLFGSIFLEIISILLMLFLSMNFTIMDRSSLPHFSIWVHWWSTWVIVSSL